MVLDIKRKSSKEYISNIYQKTSITYPSKQICRPIEKIWDKDLSTVLPKI